MIEIAGRRLTTLNRSWVSSYGEISSKAQLVREILARRGVKLGAASALSQLLKQADILTADWAAQRSSDLKVLCETAHVNRLVDAVVRLSMEPDIQEALNRMARNVMQPDARTLSQGKDALWEITLLADLRKAGIAAIAAEPDIMVKLEIGDYPIACKKIWSENNVQGQVKKATRQLTKFGGKGIIALNLDDLTPPGQVFCDEDKAAGQRFLNEFNMDFVERHRECLERSVRDAKCDGFIISTTAAAILKGEEQVFNLVTQTSLWHIRDSAPDALERFFEFWRVHSANI